MNKKTLISVILNALYIISCIICGYVFNPVCYYFMIAPFIGILFHVYRIFSSKKDKEKL